MNTERAKREKALKTANYNILLVAIFSAINFVLYIIQSNTSFLFSAFAPQFAMDIGAIWSEESGDGVFYTVGVVIAVLSVLFYAALFLIGRKKPGAIIAALIAFTLDTALLLFFVFVMIYKEYIADYILDIAFHAWVMFYCISGTVSYFKLKKLPADNGAAPELQDDYLQPANYTGQNGASYQPGEDMDTYQHTQTSRGGEPYKEPWEN